ncbi:MAG: type II secretion system ATPase GspE [Candidatus Kappaea frigidicola]|nr:type II secretion system ATPase GspE [Candidatus Kappaea frigidicola]
MADDFLRRKPLGEILLDQGIVTQEQLDQALEEQRKTGRLLGRVLVEFGFVKEERILEALGIQIGMKVTNLADMDIPEEVIKQVPPSLAQVYNVVPVKFENNIITVALSDPLNINVVDDLRFVLNCEVQGALATEEDINQAIEKYYGVTSQEDSLNLLVQEIEKSAPVVLSAEIQEMQDITSLKELASQAPVVKLVNLVLLQAVKDKASDIHFEPFEDEFKVRYRVDGVLYEITHPPKNLSLAITSRIKVMSSLDVAESRIPQDGRIMMRVAGRSVDLRVSTLPTVFGESVVMRVLDRSVVSLDLNEVGLTTEQQDTILKLISKPNGIILATGPTGCGKTTTLYSCLRKVNKPEYKIITTEDPVEYDISGIIQVSIKPKINLTFATCLRHILRQDPDIIMVGEIRDKETAQISIQASLTGHLVFSTLHTNDAPGAITRLIDMGIEPFLITSTLESVVAQRLIRVLCPKCKEAYTPVEYELSQINLSPDKAADKTFYRAKGCRECNDIGYKGRTGIFEMLMMSDKIRNLIMDKAHTALLRKKAVEEGMRTLRDDGLLRIYDGLTTIEEVIRETQGYS